MPEVPKPDLEKIRQIHRSLRRHRDVNQGEWFHRTAIALLLVVGFIGFFFGHFRTLFFVGIIYFIVAVWQGLISFRGRRLGRRAQASEDEDSSDDEV